MCCWQQTSWRLTAAACRSCGLQELSFTCRQQVLSQNTQLAQVLVPSVTSDTFHATQHHHWSSKAMFRKHTCCQTYQHMLAVWFFNAGMSSPSTGLLWRLALVSTNCQAAWVAPQRPLPPASHPVATGSSSNCQGLLSMKCLTVPLGWLASCTCKKQQQ